MVSSVQVFKAAVLYRDSGGLIRVSGVFVMLTEERVLQTQEGVFLGGGHLTQLACSGGGRVEESWLLGWSEQDRGVVEKLGWTRELLVGCNQAPRRGTHTWRRESAQSPEEHAAKRCQKSPTQLGGLFTHKYS